jgi:hypothetical protein
MKNRFKLYATFKSTMVRVDSIDEFQKYIYSQSINDFFAKQTIKLASDPKAKPAPFVYEVSEQEFEMLLREIKAKIGSRDKEYQGLTAIILREDSRHYPLIKIVPQKQDHQEESKL